MLFKKQLLEDLITGFSAILVLILKGIGIPLMHIINFCDYIAWLVVYFVYIRRRDNIQRIPVDLFSFYGFHKRFQNMTYEDRLKLKDFQLVETKQQEDEITGEPSYYFKRTIIDQSFVSHLSVKSMSVLWKFLETKYGSNRICMGSRLKLRKKEVFLDEENKQKPWITTEYPEDSKDSIILENYTQVEQDIETLQVGLRHLFKQHLSPKDREDRVKICFICDTCREWLKLAHGCFQTDQAIVCTAFPTLGFDGIKSIFNETESSILFISLDHLTTLFQLLAKRTDKNQLKNSENYEKTLMELFFKAFPTLRHIIFIEEKFLDKKYQDQIHNNYRNGILKELFNLPNLKASENSDKLQHLFFSYDELFELGANLKSKMNPEEYVPQIDEKDVDDKKSDETIVIMYTSGTTMEPKGVEISHKNIISSVSGISEGIGHLDTIDYSYLSYLPLSHIFEFIAGLFVLSRGGRLCFSSPKTLTSAATALREKKINGTVVQERVPSIIGLGDLEAFKPEILVTVPRVPAVLQRGIESEIYTKPNIELEKLKTMFNIQNLKNFELFSQFGKVLTTQIVKFMFSWGYEFKKRAILKPLWVRWPLHPNSDADNTETTKNHKKSKKRSKKLKKQCCCCGCCAEISKFFKSIFQNYVPFGFYGPRECPLWNALIFNKIRAKVGGNLLVFVNGGAPITKSTQEFLRVCFSFTAIQGYGLTESCAVSFVQNAFLPPKPCIAGAPLNSVEVSFRDCPESGYETKKLQKTFRNGMEILMCGEVLLRGNPVFKGYYKKPELTKEAFIGKWFKTGDIGMIYTDGSIQIVDRVKNISKLAHGEYLSCESLEAIMNLSTTIQTNGICVHLDPQHSFYVAVVCPNWGMFQNGKNDEIIVSDFEINERIKPIILKDLQKQCKIAEFSNYATVRDIIIDKEGWTTENGCLTASLKMKRRNIISKHLKEIEKLLERLK